MFQMVFMNIEGLISVKKLMALALVLIAMTVTPALAIYNGEIRFRDISWEYPFENFGGVFMQDAGISADALSLKYEENYTGICYDDVLSQSIKPLEKQGVPFFQLIFKLGGALNVAGYTPMTVNMYAIPQQPVTDANTEWRSLPVYAANYYVGNADKGIHDDLAAKLTALYGEYDYRASYDLGETMAELKGSIVCHDVWLGQNNTCVALAYSQDYSGSITINYQRTDIDSMIAAYKNAAAGDTNGL